MSTTVCMPDFSEDPNKGLYVIVCVIFPCFVLHVLISVPFATVCAGLSLFVFVFPCLCWFFPVCVCLSLFVHFSQTQVVLQIKFLELNLVSILN